MAVLISDSRYNNPLEVVQFRSASNLRLPSGPAELSSSKKRALMCVSLSLMARDAVAYHRSESSGGVGVPEFTYSMLIHRHDKYKFQTRVLALALAHPEKFREQQKLSRSANP